MSGNDSDARIRYVRSRIKKIVPRPHASERRRYHSQCRTGPIAYRNIETSGWFVSWWICVISASGEGAARAMRRPQISSSQKSVKRPRRRSRTPMSRIAASVALRNLRSAHHHAADSVGAELARRHAEALAELLAEVVLRVEAAAAGDLRHAQVAPLEQPRRFLQPLFLEEVAQESAGDAVEASGDVLSRVAELFGHGLDCHFFVGAQAPANGFDEVAQQAVHLRPPGTIPI